MKRPDKNDYLMFNGADRVPNQNEYIRQLEKYINHLEAKNSGDIHDVSESELEDKLYAKCLEGMPDITIDEFNDALTEWVHKEVKRKQVENFDSHSR